MIRGTLTQRLNYSHVVSPDGRIRSCRHLSTRLIINSKRWLLDGCYPVDIHTDNTKPRISRGFGGFQGFTNWGQFINQRVDPPIGNQTVAALDHPRLFQTLTDTASPQIRVPPSRILPRTLCFSQASAKRPLKLVKLARTRVVLDRATKIEYDTYLRP